MVELKSIAEERDTASILLRLGAKPSESDQLGENRESFQFNVGSGHRIPVYNVPAAKVVAQLRVAVRLEAAARKRAEQVNAIRAAVLLKSDTERQHSSPQSDTDPHNEFDGSEGHGGEGGHGEDDDDDDDEPDGEEDDEMDVKSSSGQENLSADSLSAANSMGENSKPEVIEQMR
jgi:hypothetical protein